MPERRAHDTHAAMEKAPESPDALAYGIMLATSLFFSTNIVFGRYVVADTAPFVLATIRWAAVAAILMPFAITRSGAAMRQLLTRRWPLLALLGFLGMGICGGGVYLGLSLTTATNATLIYSVSPVLIIMLEALFKGRRTGLREIIGAVLAFAGVAWIVLRGDPGRLASFQFNTGDLLIALAALSWAVYSILYRSRAVSGLDNIALFALVAVFGALANLPFAAWDLANGAGLPSTANAWKATAGIVVISSLMAFLGFQYGVRRLGASVAGLFMYLMTPWGVLMAVVFLGERLSGFHAVGIALVMGGVILATLPASLVAGLSRKPA